MNNLELTELIIRMFRENIRHRIVRETSFEIKISKSEFISKDIFNIITYDEGLTIDIANDILEVAEVIAKRQNFEYIKDESNYKKFIIVANLFYKNGLIEWGTSIRGCWFDFEGIYKMAMGYKRAEWSNYKDLNDECICKLIEYFRSDKI